MLVGVPEATKLLQSLPGKSKTVNGAQLGQQLSCRLFNFTEIWTWVKYGFA